MTIDLTKNTYTIVGINQTGDVTVKFDVDNKEQTIGGLPLQSPEALKVSIDNYLQAYKQGLQQEMIQQDAAIDQMIGQKQTSYLETPETTPQVVVIAEAGSPVDKLVHGEVTTTPITEEAPAITEPTKVQEVVEAPVPEPQPEPTPEQPPTPDTAPEA